MNVKELIKEFEEIGIHGLNMFGTVVKGIPTETAIDLIKQLDEPQPVKVKQFVADFIAEQKKLGHTLSYSIDASMSDRVAEWYWDNSELFAQAWIFGYEIEKEKQYLVNIKATKHYLVKDGNGKIFFSLAFKGYFTKKELEEADFGWVFDCPGVEVKEVER